VTADIKSYDEGHVHMLMFADMRATADRSRSLNNDMQRTVSNIRAQLRTMAAWKIG